MASQELRELRTEAERKREGEKEEVRREQKRQLQVFREEQEDKLNKVGPCEVSGESQVTVVCDQEKAEIEENRREQLEALRREEQLKVCVVTWRSINFHFTLTFRCSWSWRESSQWRKRGRRKFRLTSRPSLLWSKRFIIMQNLM